MLLQLWLVALIGMMARASPVARLLIALSVAALSTLALPSNLWRPQLKRLGSLALLIFVFTALGAGVQPSFHLKCKRNPQWTALRSESEAVHVNDTIRWRTFHQGLIYASASKQGCCADGVPPVQQERGLPAAMEGLPGSVPYSGGYRYVLFHFWFITITRRSLSVAIAASCLMFVALQVGAVMPHLPHGFLEGRPLDWTSCCPAWVVLLPCTQESTQPPQ